MALAAVMLISKLLMTTDFLCYGALTSIPLCFSALLPRVNVWLRDRPRCTVIKCETIEKRISSLDRLLSNDPKFDVASADTVVYIILGLR